MLALRRFLTVVVMVYLLLALLFIVVPGARDSMMSMFNGSPTDFWFTMTIIGTALLLVQLLLENAYTATMRRDIGRQEGKINELKAKLYDHQLDQRDRDLRTATTAVPPTGQLTPDPGSAPAFTPPAPAPNAIPRTGTAVPPPSAVDLPPSVLPPTTHPTPDQPYPGAPNQHPLA